jgi:hypothetical protein
VVLGIFVSGCNSDPANPDGGAIESLEVIPATAWLVTGTALQLDGVARDQNGVVINGPLRWTSSNSSVATVSGAGLVTARSPGSSTIQAEAGGVRTSSAITVTTAASAVSWIVENEGITDASVLGVWADANSPLAIVAGQNGQIMESSGSGWMLVQLPTQESLTGVWGSSGVPACRTQRICRR